MPAKPVLSLTFEPSIVRELACPVCKGDLSLDGSRLVCISCRRAYPIVEGIPVLIAERAEAAPGRDVAADS
jgi:uncharacterized protein